MYTHMHDVLVALSCRRRMRWLCMRVASVISCVHGGLRSCASVLAICMGLVGSFLVVCVGFHVGADSGTCE